MASRAIVFLVLSLAIFPMTASRVAARELSDTTTTTSSNNSKETEKANGLEDAKYTGEGYPDGYGGYPGGGRYGGNPGGGCGGRGCEHYGGYCRYGCCQRNYYGSGCRRCCAYKGEAMDAEPEAKLHN